MSRINMLVLALVALATSLSVPVSGQQSSRPVALDSAKSRRPATKLLPGTRIEVFATIRGSVVDSVNAALPNSSVRLRDGRVGHVVDAQVTDKSGIFTFFRLDPGYYIVELVGVNETTVAATSLIPVSAGETASALVKLPIRPSMFTSLLRLGKQDGSNSSASVSGLIPAITDQLPQAILQGIPAVVPPGNPVSER